MIIAAATFQPSLTDPPPTGALAPAATWVTDLMFGPLATTIAVIAIAWVGFAMLSGRVDIKRGLSVVFGCFLLLGARGMVDGLRTTTAADGAVVSSNVPPLPTYAKAKSTENPTNAYDPYAGAAVLGARQ
jgi:type IV secretory pathway VirB2 component (pilin)